MLDPERLQALLDYLEKHGLPFDEDDGSYFFDGHPPAFAVPLELFFEGNDQPDVWFAVNWARDDVDVYAALAALRDHPDVADLQIGITSIEPQDHTPWWAYSDTVYVSTRRLPREIGALLGTLAPDKIYAVDPDDIPVGMHAPLDDGSVIAIWWD